MGSWIIKKPACLNWTVNFVTYSCTDCQASCVQWVRTTSARSQWSSMGLWVCFVTSESPWDCRVRSSDSLLLFTNWSRCLARCPLK
jgi:hypothetical protein